MDYETLTCPKCCERLGFKVDPKASLCQRCQNKVRDESRQKDEPPAKDVAK